MPKYISLMSDFGFKRVFANPEYPHILISFIESVLPELSIESIEYIDTTQFADYVDDRTSIFDVFCRLNDGSFVIVEMQQVRQEYYVDRTILYGSHVIQRQSQKGKWNYELPRVYVISLMNFRLFPNDRSLVHMVKLQYDQNPDQPFYDKLNFIYIQLPNITEEFSQNPNLEHWLTMIRNLHTREEPMSVDSNTKFTKAMIDAMTLAEFEKLTPEQKIIIDITQYAETEEYSKMWTAHNDGKREGLQEGIEQGVQKGIELGREEGEHQKALETARNLLNMGLSIEQIAQATGLDIEEVKGIKTSLNLDTSKDPKS